MNIHKTNFHLNFLPLEGKEATIKTTIRAFTLVELIVVITILAILGMISFISLQGYSADARDSSRISDVNHIKTSLELQSLAAGKYPMPDNAQDVTLSGGTVIVWHQGTVGENVTKILSRNLNEKPTDPLYNTEYIYSVTPTQGQYEVMSIYEGDMVYNVNQPHPSIANQPHPSPLLRGEGIEGGGIIEKANAISNTIRIDGTYNGVYVKSNAYIIPTPSIITSLDPTGLELNETTIKSQVIDRGTNVPNIGTPKITQSTGALTFSNFEVYNGTLNQESSTGFLLAYQALANTYNGSSLADELVIKTLLTQTTDEQKIEFTKSLVLSTPTGTSSPGDTGTSTYNCDETTKPTDNGYITYTTGTPTSANQTYIQDATNCGYTCTDGYIGTNCEIAPIVQWKDIPGTNCTNDDITIGGKIWAGCNSVLGNGLIYNANNYCWNYVGANLGGTSCYGDTTKENDYNATYGENNIWGKLYLWSNLTTACKNPTGGSFSNTTTSTSNCPCPTGWHVPSDQEFEALETTLNGGTNCRNSTDGWLCDGLGWSVKSTKTSSNNMIKALKLPLAGARGGGVFYDRGGHAYLWSSTEYNSSTARGRRLTWNNSSVYRYIRDKSTYGFSVRCIKD